jgi:hypothetical protein
MASARRDKTLSIEPLGKHLFGGEEYQRVLMIEVEWSDGALGGKRGYYLRVSVESRREREGMVSRLIGVGTGSTRALLQEATRYNAKVLEHWAERAEADPRLPGMKELVLSRQDRTVMKV